MENISEIGTDDDSRPYQVIIHNIGDIDGFGFGLDVCPLGCALPGAPLVVPTLHRSTPLIRWAP
jgi:hypothetical protein